MSESKSVNSSADEQLFTGMSGDDSESDDKVKLGSRRRTEGNQFFDAIKDEQNQVYKKINLVEEEIKVLPYDIKREILMYKSPRHGIGKIANKKTIIEVDPDKEFLSSIFKNTKNISRIHQSEIRNSPPTEEIITIEENTVNEDTNKMTEMAIVIQAHFKGYHEKKKYKIISKAFRYRRHVINELIKTDDAFVESLKKVVEKVKNMATSRGLLDLTEIDKLFINIDAIIIFNTQFSNTLKENYKNYNPNTTLLAKGLEKHIPGFRLYNHYCYHFEESANFLKKLRETKNHPFIADLLLKVEETPELENLTLESILVKPVQRLPKYVLLFRDLLKHTKPEHPDYKNVQASLNLFVKINDENNQKMDRYLRNLKMFELEKNFGNSELKILDSKREFISEETMGLIADNETIGLAINQYTKSSQPVICYLLSDLILITRKSESGDQLIDYITLTSSSFVKDIPDSKYFSNLFSIIGENSCQTFSADDKQHKEKHMNQVNGLLAKLNKKIQEKKEVAKIHILDIDFGKNLEALSTKLTVNVVGTEERNITNVASRHTVYKIELNYNSFNYKFDLRYSEMVNLEKLIKEKYPKIKVPHLSTTHWFTYRKTKIIEGRKLLIENFLHQILLNEKILKDPDFVLNYLNLPTDFYEIIEIKPALSIPLSKPTDNKQKSEDIKIFLPKQQDLMKEMAQLHKRKTVGNAVSKNFRLFLLISMVLNYRILLNMTKKQKTQILQDKNLKKRI